MVGILIPVTDFVVEDIKASTKTELISGIRVLVLWRLVKMVLLSTESNRASRRNSRRPHLPNAICFGAEENCSKLAPVFEAHCVDSWVLTHHLLGGSSKPDNTQLLHYTPQLLPQATTPLQAEKGMARTRYGGTMCAGFKRLSCSSS
jgi:hypothetical protein